jgi:hypothetical protein
VPVPKEIRELAYDISPSFRKLEKQLEGELGKRWITLGGTFSNVSDDISGGVFVVAVREAAQNLGYFETGQKAESFFRAVADEINGACREGALPCGPEHSALRPIFHKSYIVPWLISFCEGLFQLWYPPPDLMTETLQSDIYALPQFYRLLGSQVNLPRYSNFDRQYYLKNNPDVAALHVDPFEDYLVRGRFQGREPNGIIKKDFDSNYYLKNNPDVAAMNMDPYGHYISFGQFEGRSPGPDKHTDSALRPLEKRVDSIQYVIRNIFRVVHSAFVKIFSICGLFLLLRFLSNVIRRRPMSHKDIVAGVIFLVAAAGICSRIALMAYCDATTYPGFGGYLLPAYSLFSVFCAVAAVQLLDSLFNRSS